jgi:putative endonuclease
VPQAGAFDGGACIRYYAYAGWSSLVARRAHNPEVVGSNPTPATNSSIRGRAQAPGLFTLRPMSRVTCKPYFVYVLWSASGHKYYIGISENPTSRLFQHNSGISKWTARHLPWELVHVERHEDYSDARRRELLLKRQKGGRGLSGSISACALSDTEERRFIDQKKASGIQTDLRALIMTWLQNHHLRGAAAFLVRVVRLPVNEGFDDRRSYS